MGCSSSEGMGDAYREDPEARQHAKRIEMRVAELEQALCGLCQMMEAANRAGDSVEIHPQLQAWFDKHRSKPGCVSG